MTGFTPPLSSTDPDRHHRTGPTTHAGAQSRHEPTINGVNDTASPSDTSQVNPAYEQFQREYAERYAQYEQPNVPRRRLPRLAYMAAVFVVGAGVGLGSAWWFGQQSSPAAHGVPGISSNKPLLPPLAEARKSTTPLHGADTRGISRSELPYDGAPPPDDASEMPIVPPLASASRSRPTASLNSSGNSAEDVESAVTRAAPVTPVAPMEPVAPVASAAPVRQDSGKPQTAKEAPLTLASKEESERPKPEPKSTVTATKRRTDTKVAKDHEIERIRQQAEEELKKKTADKRRVEQARVAKKSGSGSSGATSGSSNENTVTARSGGEGVLAKVHGTQVMLARCEQASNIFLREQCKWKLCNGMWGRNGCPSYSKPAGNNAY